MGWISGAGVGPWPKLVCGPDLTYAKSIDLEGLNLSLLTEAHHPKTSLDPWIIWRPRWLQTGQINLHAWWAHLYMPINAQQ